MGQDIIAGVSKNVFVTHNTGCSKANVGDSARYPPDQQSTTYTKLDNTPMTIVNTVRTFDETNTTTTPTMHANSPTTPIMHESKQPITTTTPRMHNDTQLSDDDTESQDYDIDMGSRPSSINHINHIQQQRVSSEELAKEQIRLRDEACARETAEAARAEKEALLARARVFDHSHVAMMERAQVFSDLQNNMIYQRMGLGKEFIGKASEPSCV